MVIDISGGPDAESYPISYLNGVPEGGWTEEYKTTKLVLSKINAGKFTMGSPNDEIGRVEIEVQHEVTLTKSFFAGVFEVTQNQYGLVTGEYPSYCRGGMRPVECSYSMIRGGNKGAHWPANSDVDENSFFGILRAKTGLEFDLPTEAQWEYACRAGTTTALNSGKNLSDKFECDEMAEVGRYSYNGGHDEDEHYYAAHTVVGSYLPNAWGLYDMHGNVSEWCLDWWEELNGFPATDPKGGKEGEERVLRGGSWADQAESCRSAERFYSSDPDDIDYGTRSNGFRVFLVQ